MVYVGENMVKKGTKRRSKKQQNDDEMEEIIAKYIKSPAIIEKFQEALKNGDMFEIDDDLLKRLAEEANTSYIGHEETNIAVDTYVSKKIIELLTANVAHLYTCILKLGDVINKIKNAQHALVMGLGDEDFLGSIYDEQKKPSSTETSIYS